ncbi:MAG: transcriptional regulator [Asgard group archaeon]
MKTRRQLIIKLLKENKNPLSLDYIAEEIFINKKTVIEDLSHIAKTLKGKGKFQLIMFPPQCRICGFIFKNLKKPKLPSKCPKCKKGKIIPPEFTIKEIK